jgi:hypothetical protein
LRKHGELIEGGFESMMSHGNLLPTGPKPLTFDGILAKADCPSISFDDVVKRYDVSASQLKADMKELRWKKIAGVYHFNLAHIRKKYQVDPGKLNALAKLQAMKEG